MGEVWRKTHSRLCELLVQMGQGWEEGFRRDVSGGEVDIPECIHDLFSHIEDIVIPMTENLYDICGVHVCGGICMCVYARKYVEVRDSLVRFVLLLAPYGFPELNSYNQSW